MTGDQSAAARRLIDAIGRHVGQIAAQTIVETSCWRAHTLPVSLKLEELPALAPELEKGVRLFVKEPAKLQLCLREISHVVARQRTQISAPRTVKVPIVEERHLLDARGLARELAVDLGFSFAEQTQIATVVSELVRNILLYAGTGMLTLTGQSSPRPSLQVVAEDQGPGIADLESVLSGQRRSRTGMGLGLRGSRNLMDEFEIVTSPGKGVRVTATKYRR